MSSSSCRCRRRSRCANYFATGAAAIGAAVRTTLRLQGTHSSCACRCCWPQVSAQVIAGDIAIRVVEAVVCAALCHRGTHADIRDVSPSTCPSSDCEAARDAGQPSAVFPPPPQSLTLLEPPPKGLLLTPPMTLATPPTFPQAALVAFRGHNLGEGTCCTV
jgi:hypothetical protein